jgi:hypothetical protein
LPNGPPGSNWQSSQSSTKGNPEAGPSWSAGSSSVRGSPPRYNGQRAAPYSQQRGPRRPPRWKQDAYEEGEMPREDAYEPYDDTERPRRSVSPPPRRDFSASRDRSPIEDGFRFSDRIAPRDREDDDRPPRRPRDVDAWRSRDIDEPRNGYRSPAPVWSDNRRYSRPAPRWEPPPTVIGKRSRYNADQYDRPQDKGWSARPARSHRSAASVRTM